MKRISCVAFIAVLSILSMALELSPELLNLKQNAAATRSDYLKLADNYYNLFKSYPDGQGSEEVIYYTAMAYGESYRRFANENDRLSQIKFLRYLATNFTSDLAAQSYIETAKLYEADKDLASALYNYSRVVSLYHGTEYADEAQRAIENLEAGRSNISYTDPPPVSSGAGTTSSPNTTASTEIVSQSSSDDVANVIDAITNNEVNLGGVSYSYNKASEGKATIKAIRFYSHKDYTRVVIDTNKDANFDAKWLKSDPSKQLPPRVFIDVKNSTVEPSVSNRYVIKDGLITEIRWAYNQPNVARIVLDTEFITSFKVFPMYGPNRIVIDLSNARDNIAASGTDTNVSQDVDVDTLAKVMGVKVKRIVIDPGHGGKDPGAIHNGLTEKSVNLDIALKLAAKLKRHKDLQVYLTRQDDRYISLEERTAYANRHKADAFISIHANAHRNKSVYGTMTFVLNVTNDKTSLEIAAKENQATQKNMSDIQGILQELLRYSKLEESLTLATFIQNGIVNKLGRTGSFKNGVRQAPFYVLVGANMPSVLIETAFISNPDDARILGSPSGIEKIVDGTYNGLMGYINAHNQ